MPIAALKSRYDAFAERLLASLSEIERRDVRAFDHWFYRERRLALAGRRWSLRHDARRVARVAAAVEHVVRRSGGPVQRRRAAARLVGRSPRGSAIAGSRAASSAASSSTPIVLAAARRARRRAASPGSSRARIRSTLLQRQRAAAPRRHRRRSCSASSTRSLVALIAQLRNREYAALTAHLEAEARQSELSRQLAESRLKLLQLQIEPHFLFNTLGSAQQLAEKGAPEAARLIADLIRFLRAATPALRDEATTLRQEAALVERVPRDHADAPRRAGSTYRDRHAGRRSPTADSAGHADHAGRERDQARHRARRRAAAASTSPRASTARRCVAARRRHRRRARRRRSRGRASASPTSASASRCCTATRAALELEENAPRGFRRAHRAARDARARRIASPRNVARRASH